MAHTFKNILPFFEFKIHGKSSDKVLIFDIDDTLLKSKARVSVMKGNEVVQTLSSQEYNNYKLNPGEKFNYDEFTSLDILLQSEMTKYFETLKREYRKGTHISILTARGNKDMIYKFFITKGGIDIHKDLIFATGDDKKEGTVAQKKARCIKQLASYGYKTLIFFDDNVDNLEAVKSMEQSLGVTIHTVQA